MDYWKKQEKLDNKWKKKHPDPEPVEPEVHCDKFRCIYCDAGYCSLNDYECRISLDMDEFYGVDAE